VAATASRIGFITSEFRLATASEPDVVAKYGTAARDTPQPLESFFDDPAHAQVMAAERLTLLGGDRRRFVVICSGIHALPSVLQTSPLLPVARVVDQERSADLAAAIVEIGIDFENDRTTFGPWG
jgi:hypothetical protein